MTAVGATARSSACALGEALAWFDGLAPVEPDAMWGMWRGEGFASGHPLDGLLEACHWHGKRFDDAERVHPLVFDAPGGGTLSVRPMGVRLALWLVARWPALKSPGVGRMVQAGLPLVRTRRPRARLRLMQHRGVLTAAMVYDDLPIIDVFRRIDADTVLGLMDMKGMERPFFFLLRRELPPASAWARCPRPQANGPPPQKSPAPGSACSAEALPRSCCLQARAAPGSPRGRTPSREQQPALTPALSQRRAESARQLAAAALHMLV